MVTLGRTTASTCMSMALPSQCERETSKLTTPRETVCVVVPPMPLICLHDVVVVGGCVVPGTP